MRTIFSARRTTSLLVIIIITIISFLTLTRTEGRRPTGRPAHTARLERRTPQTEGIGVGTSLIGKVFSGKVTYYGDGYKTIQGGADPPPIAPYNGGGYGACYNIFGEDRIVLPKNFNKFAALNTYQYRTLGAKKVCSLCLQLSYNNASTVVQIVDSCPGCKPYGVDIARSAMSELVGGWDQAWWIGTIENVTWYVVSCDLIQQDTVFRFGGPDPADFVIRTGIITT
ncbi:hypothetical protein HK104_005754 [Borealophlyctis nickersoniae]|nr:hypothetical protein HK104_005754 [Borealophlyctis nickersoniae]